MELGLIHVHQERGKLIYEKIIAQMHRLSCFNPSSKVFGYALDCRIDVLFHKHDYGCSHTNDCIHIDH